MGMRESLYTINLNQSCWDGHLSLWFTKISLWISHCCVRTWPGACPDMASCSGTVHEAEPEVPQADAHQNRAIYLGRFYVFQSVARS